MTSNNGVFQEIIKDLLPEQENKKLQLNGNSYAAQTWSNIPNNDGRRIQISWMRQILPNMPFGQFMSFPHSLTLTRKNDESI